MPVISPMLDNLRQRGAMLTPENALPAPDLSPTRFQIAGFGDAEAEFEAIRSGRAVLPNPGRGALRVRGEERFDFLQRLLTQDVADLSAGEIRNAFWLNRKGRIEADLRLVGAEDSTWLLLDAPVASDTQRSLEEYVFTEDVEIEDVTPSTASLTIFDSSDTQQIPDISPILSPPHGVAEPLFGFKAQEILIHHDSLPAALARLCDQGDFKLVGWSAADRARIEAGSPVFLQDFGREALPHESGVLRDRVSFTKGCYLGQEVVARMEALGRPKQRLVSLSFKRLSEVPARDDALLDENEKAVGKITSVARSTASESGWIAFAMVRDAHAGAGAELRLGTDVVRVRESLDYREVE